MEVVKTDLDGVLLLRPQVFKDDRGYFFESFNSRVFEENTGVKVNFVQDNETHGHFGVLRGLHYQKIPYAQAKLVRMAEGKALHIVVDLRRKSATLGRHISVELTSEAHQMLYIPRGFAHGYIILSKEAVTQYKCDEFYHPASEGAVVWNDPDLAIDWHLPKYQIILSSNDEQNPPFKKGYLF